MAECGAAQVAYDLGKSLVTQWLWPRIKCHLDYWRCFRDNVQGLSDEIGLLKAEKSNMDQRIEEARLRAESATDEVQGWSEDGDQKLAEAERILQGCDGLKAWKIISRYSWGKQAKKTAEGIAKLRNGANDMRISNPAPPPAMVPTHHKPTTEFESRKRIEEDIMEFLRDDHTYMIAICGAGGIGKTTMVHRIEERVRKENLFDEVICVVVSQPFDLLKIQEEMAEILGLEFSEKTLFARAHKLRIRLQDSKRKLIIFDDVWESFELENIGVPFENGFTVCKIILTSRITDACNKMGAKSIRMELLKEEEAWALFKEKAGSYMEGPDLRPIAENIVAECKRLPVALVTVGVALKDQSIDVWKDSLSQLRIAMPIDFPEVLEDVYKPLKLSYDYLENESLKSIFLLCCLFPEDYNIPMDHLTLYGFGLGMFKGIRNIEEGRSRTSRVVEKLKGRFLLLDGDWGDRCVKMHDVVRDVAIFIGSKEKDGFLMNSLEAFSMDSSSKDSSRNCNWMSIDISTENAKLLVGSEFSNLRFMMIRDSTFDYWQINRGDEVVDVICFEGMQGLKVLSISDVYFRSLPSTMELLKELRTLRLDSCIIVKDISVIGELACLEILCIRECRNIEEVPADIGRLNILRLLEFISCRRLRRIVAGVISSLERLEELKIIDCFDKWEAKGNQSEERNAGLSELESLPNLTSLDIEISDCNLLAEEICLSQKLVRYRIHFLHARIPSWRHYDRRIVLYLPGDITVGNWIRLLARSTQSLVLEGKLCTQFPVKLAELEEIIYGTTPEVSNFIQKLESIYISKLPKLACLWKSQNQNVWLGNLESISIEGCPNLCYLFSVATSRSLVQLRDLRIEDCDKIEQVLWNGMESNTDASIIVFPNLQKLRLSKLPNLEAFSQGVDIMESLHQLTDLTIKDCPKLRIKIIKCPNIRFLMFNNFSGPQQFLCSHHVIEEIVVKDCATIEELVLWDEIKDEGERDLIFPELKKLELYDLPRLTTFCRGVESVKFPKLKGVRIGNLPKLESLLPLDLEATHDHHSLHFFGNAKNVWLGNLEYISIKGCHNLCYLFSVATARSFVQLRDLTIEDCNKIEQVLWNGMESNTDASIIVFSNLQELRLSKLPNLEAFSQGVDIIESLQHQLTDLAIEDCPKLRTKIGKCPNLRFLMFNNFSGPQQFLCSHHVIEEIVVKDCATIEELVLWDEIKDEGERDLIFPELQKLELYDLPRLTTFCRGVERIKFPKLEMMKIENLPRLNKLLPLDLEATHDHHSLHYFCNPKVEIPGLLQLFLFKLQNTISKIWCRHVPIDFFHNLNSLCIVDVNGISNLMSSVIAENLVNLIDLRIEGCQDIVDVIEDEKEVFVTTLFRRLRDLSILRSHKVRRFCQWKHALELPSLRFVTIKDCPVMETFTLGSLSTPSLFKFKIDGKDIETKDLNGGIRDRFQIKDEDKDEDEDEDPRMRIMMSGKRS